MTESGKSPLKFYAYYYSILSGDCQASIITELWRLSVVFCVTLYTYIEDMKEFIDRVTQLNRAA